MRIACKTSRLIFAALLTAGACQAFAQEAPVLERNLTPFGPGNTRYDLQLFAPPELSTYANMPRPHEGFFFQYERLYWSIQQPTRTEIGVPGVTATGFFAGPKQFDPTTQDPSNILRSYGNSLDTGFLRADQTWGNRYELGFMEDDKGWFVSIMNLQDQDQSYTAGGLINAGLRVVFNDPHHLLLGFVDSDGDGFDDDLNLTGPITPFNRVPSVFGRPSPINNLDTTGDGVPDSYAGFTDFGDEVPLVPLFDLIQVKNSTSMSGVEINRSWRYPPGHRGGVWEGFIGVRWILFRDQFDVTATGTDGLTALPGLSFWDTTVDNNMVGPQIGFRFNFLRARFNINTELRFLAAVNLQSTHINGELGSDLDPLDTPVNAPALLVRTSFQKWQYDETFAPVGELRVGIGYELTKSISLLAGYNAMLGGGLSRASRRVDYTLTNTGLGILDANKHDMWFLNGLNLGISLNR